MKRLLRLFTLVGLIFVLIVGVGWGIKEYRTRKSFELLNKAMQQISAIDEEANNTMKADVMQNETVHEADGPTPELLERAMLIKEKGQGNVEGLEAELRAETYAQLAIKLLKLADQIKSARIASAFLPTKRNILLVLQTKSQALSTLISYERGEKSRPANSYETLKSNAAWESADESLDAYARAHGYASWREAVSK